MHRVHLYLKINTMLYTRIVHTDNTVINVKHANDKQLIKMLRHLKPVKELIPLYNFNGTLI
jgi:hypothetical protein